MDGEENKNILLNKRIMFNLRGKRKPCMCSEWSVALLICTGRASVPLNLIHNTVIFTGAPCNASAVHVECAKLIYTKYRTKKGFL